MLLVCLLSFRPSHYTENFSAVKGLRYAPTAYGGKPLTAAKLFGGAALAEEIPTKIFHKEIKKMIDKKIFDDYMREKTIFETSKNYVMSGIVGATVAFEEFFEDMDIDEDLKAAILEKGGELFIKAMDAVKDEEFIG